MKRILKKSKKKKLLAAAHEMAKGMYDANIISLTTMREFDELCLPEVEDLSPTQIKDIRLKERVSQPVFAKCLNITTSTVKQWEQGEKHPRGTSLKLLNLISKKGLNVLKV